VEEARTPWSEAFVTGSSYVLLKRWPEWQPRTRVAAVEALVRFVPLAVKDLPLRRMKDASPDQAGWLRPPIVPTNRPLSNAHRVAVARFDVPILV
jgi:hypothetical protein